MKINFRNAAIAIIVINIIMFILQQVIPGLTGSLMLVSHDILTRPWILLTSMFLHGSAAHLIFNMYALLLFGTLIEQKIGTKRFVLIYFVSGILAGIGFAFFQEIILQTSRAAIGASGGMMGILGMTIMLLPNLRVLLLFFIPMSMRTAGIIFAIIDLLGVFGIGMKGIANISHLVGLACGVVYGYYLLKEKVKFQKRFAARPVKKGVHPSHTHKNIEMNKEDVQDYLRHGRL